MSDAVEEMVDVTTEEPAATPEPNTEPSESGEDASKETMEGTEDPYKSQLERAEKKIVKLKKQIKEDTPAVSTDEIRSIVQEEFNRARVADQAIKREKLLEQVSTSEAHRKLLEFALDNDVKSSGDIETDLEKALKFVEADRVMGENSALKSAKISTITASGAQFGGHPTQKKERDTRSKAQKEFERKFRAANNLPIK